MRLTNRAPVSLGNWSYTRGVNAPRLCFATAVGALVGGLLASSVASAQDQTSSRDVARTVGQTARATADAADAIADEEVSANQEENPIARARRGVVVLEQGGKVIGLGSVLSQDGRILTALSVLGHGNNLDARFADGSVSRVRVGHSDRAWDLALLVPQNGRWKEGLRASRQPPTQAGSDLRSFSVVGAKKDVLMARTIVKGQRTLVGGDSELLRDALEMASRFNPTDLGSPIIDKNGDVVALLGRACAPVANGPCSMVPYGVPVSAIKAFLRTVPNSAVPPAPWLGIQGAAEDTGVVRGVRVLSVHGKSPAAAAGLAGSSADKAKSDVVVAVDGTPVTTPEALANEVNARAVGDSLELLLFGNGKFREATVTLQAAPNTQRPTAGTVPLVRQRASRQHPPSGASQGASPAPRGRIRLR